MEDDAEVPVGLFALTAAINLTKTIAFIAITRAKQPKAKQGEMSMLQLGMWRKTEAKCWQADVLADNT